MLKHGELVLGMLMLSMASSVVAQSALERQLAGAFGARNDKLDIDKSKRKPEWKQAQYSKTPGKGCVITYYSGDQAVSYLGPTDNMSEAFVSVTNSAIPNASKPVVVNVTLSTEGEPERTVPATHLTINGLDQGMILFLLPNIESGLDVMKDVEGIRVTMNKKLVFNLRWNGGHAARDKMRACLNRTTN